jgi:ABC-type tungstate transport system permease subunit
MAIGQTDQQCGVAASQESAGAGQIDDRRAQGFQGTRYGIQVLILHDRQHQKMYGSGTHIFRLLLNLFIIIGPPSSAASPSRG